LTSKFDDDLIHIEKWHPKRPIACVYWNPSKELFFVKRFLVETLTKKHQFIDEDCELKVVSVAYNPKVNVSFNKRLKETKDLKDKVFELNKVIDVKGDKAQGNQLTKLKIKDIQLLPVSEEEKWPIETEEEKVMVEIEDTENEEVVVPENDSSNETTDKKKVVDESQEDKEKIEVNTNSEGAVELEWEVDDKSNDKDLDDDGQMKIF